MVLSLIIWDLVAESAFSNAALFAFAKAIENRSIGLYVDDKISYAIISVIEQFEHRQYIRIWNRR